MAKEQIWCDRCDDLTLVDVFETIHSHTEILVGGYRLITSEGQETIWSNFGRPGEEFICNKCMRSDPAFKNRYPWLQNHVPLMETNSER